MLVDFGDLKSALMQAIHEPYDHRMMLWDQDDVLVPMIDLSENGIGISFSPTKATQQASPVTEPWRLRSGG